MTVSRSFISLKTDEMNGNDERQGEYDTIETTGDVI